MKKRFIAGFLLVTVGFVGSACFGSSSSAAVVSRERVIGMLSGIESFPGREEWVGLGADAIVILIAVANDGDEAIFRRARALTALGYFSDPSATETLEAFANSGASPSLQRSALLALATANPERAMASVERALASPDALLRQTAVKALGKMPGASATEALQAQLEKEPEPFVREEIQRAIRLKN